MFVHVIPKTKLRKLTGVLTYRTNDSVVPGQLVTVKVRGRKIPGIVDKIKVNAGTTATILPLHQLGRVVVPPLWRDLLRAVMRRYDINMARSLTALAPALNLSYLPQSFTTHAERQQLWLTPSYDTPFARSLAPDTQVIPTKLPERRESWLRAAQGLKLSVLGNLAAASLPFRHLEQVVIDAPFSSPYTDERAPAINAAWLALTQGQLHQAAITVRSAVPTSLIARHFAVSSPINAAKLTLHPINLWKARTNYLFNDQFIAELTAVAQTGRRVLIYANVLDHRDPKTGTEYGLKTMAAEIKKKSGLACGIWRHGSKAKDTPITLATSTVLFSSQQFDHAFVPSLEKLVSPLRPASALEALEMLGILASRSPLTAQFVDTNHWLVAALRQKFILSTADEARLPTMNQRLISFTQRKISVDRVPEKIAELWPKNVRGVEEGKPTVVAITTDQLNEEQRTFITTLPTSWSVKTRAQSLPKQT